MIINIDFDGTCVTHDFPSVGKDIGAVSVKKKMIENGHKLILFTMRSNKRSVSPTTGKEEDGGLQDAINWFKENNINLYGIQSNPTQELWTSSPKSYADLMIDDSALGCPLIYNPSFHQRPYVDWVRVENMLKENGFIDTFKR